MRYLKKSALILVSMLLLAACGQRGPLYLPQQNPEENQAKKQETSSPIQLPEGANQ